MDANYALVSLGAIVAAIGISFFRKINTGILCLAFAVLIGKMADLPESSVVNGWNTNLFVMLLGIMFLFSIAQVNGTLHLLSRKVVAGTRNAPWSLPLVIFYLALFLSAFSSPIPVMALLIPLSVTLAVELDASPLLFAPLPVLGSAAGGISPLATTGIMTLSLAGEQGTVGIALPFFLRGIVVQTGCMLILFFVFGGYRLKAGKELYGNLPSFDWRQRWTLFVIAFFMVNSLIFRWNTGLMSFIAGAFLLLSGAAEEKECFLVIPWGTIIMICGVGVLMGIVMKLGGVAVLSDFLARFMTRDSASAVMALTAGIMSWFSSTAGVVIPTLVPTMSRVMSDVPGTDALDLLCAIVNTSHVAGISPLSTGGGLALAACSAAGNMSLERRNKLFVGLFLISLFGIVLLTLLARAGGYRIIH